MVTVQGYRSHDVGSRSDAYEKGSCREVDGNKYHS